MSVRKLWWLLVVLLCSPILIVAQDDNGQVITAENASQIQQIDHIGGVEPGQLMWSPAGNSLAIGSSEGVQIYAAGSAGDSLLQLPGSLDVIYNATGELLVSGNYLLNTATGETVAELEPHVATYVSPEKDVLALVSSGENSTQIDIWNISSPASASLIATLDTESQLVLKQLNFSPDESQLAIALENDTPMGDASAIAQLWDINSGERIFANTFPYDILDAVLFSGDGQYFIVGNRAGGVYGEPAGDVYVYRIDPLVFEAQWDKSFYPVLSADGLWLAYATLYYETKLLQLGENVGELITLETTDPMVTELPDFAPGAAVFETIGVGKLLGSQLLQVPVFPDLQRNISAQATGQSWYVFSPDGLALATTSGYAEDIVTFVWDTQTGELTGTIEDVTARGFSPDHRLLAVVDSDGLQLWDVLNAQLAGKFAGNSTFNQDWSRLAYREGSQVIVVDLVNGETTTLTVASDFSGQSTGINLAAGQATFIGTELQLRDLETGEITFSQPVSASPPQVIFDGIGKRFAVIETRSGERFPIPFSVSIRSLDTPDVEITQIALGELSSASVLLTPDGSYLVVNSTEVHQGESETKETIYDAETGEVIFSKEVPTRFNHAVSPDGKLLVIATSEEASILQLDGLPDHEPVEIAKLKSSRVPWVPRFNPDGRVFAIDVLLVETNPIGGFQLHPFLVDDLLSRNDIIDLDDLSTAKFIRNVRSYELSPDAQTVLIVEGNIHQTDPVKLVDIATQEVYASWSGIEPIAFNNAGTLAATAMLTPNGSQVMIWDVTQLMNGNTTPIITLPENQKLPLDIKFSRDDTRLYIRDDAGVNVWGLSD